MATRSRSKKVVVPEIYVPPTYNIQVNSIIDCSAEVNEAFNLMLQDYCKRFDVKVRPERETTKIMYSVVMLGEGQTDGLCAMDVALGNTMSIQNRCPMLESWAPYRPVLGALVEVMCHEFVHACQGLTGRSGFDITVKRLGTDGEGYFFDQEEMEARMLASFYSNSVAIKPIQAIIDKYQNAFGDMSEAIFDDPNNLISQAKD